MLHLAAPELLRERTLFGFIEYCFFIVSIFAERNAAIMLFIEHIKRRYFALVPCRYFQLCRLKDSGRERKGETTK